MTKVEKILRDHADELKASSERLRAMSLAAADKDERDALLYGAYYAKSAAEDILNNIEGT